MEIKKNRNTLCPNAESVRRGAVGAEDRAPKAPGVSMQLGSLGERCKPPNGSGRSPAAKRHLVHFWSKNALSVKTLNAARDLGSAVSSPSRCGRSLAAKRHLVHFWSNNDLSVKTLNAARDLREHCKLPSGSGQSPAAKRHLMHFWSENALSGKALAS